MTTPTDNIILRARAIRARAKAAEREMAEYGMALDEAREEIAALKAEVERLTWMLATALRDEAEIIEREWGISYWPTEEQPATLDDWLDEDQAREKWIRETKADLTRRYEEEKG